MNDEITERTFNKNNTTFNINGTVDDFIKYEMYKDSKRFKFKNITPQTRSFIFGICAIIIMSLTFLCVVDIMTPKPPSTFKLTWEGIGMFLCIAAGIGWIFHGTGFLLVRR